MRFTNGLGILMSFCSIACGCSAPPAPQFCCPARQSTWGEALYAHWYCYCSPVAGRTMSTGQSPYAHKGSSQCLNWQPAEGAAGFVAGWGWTPRSWNPRVPAWTRQCQWLTAPLGTWRRRASDWRTKRLRGEGWGVALGCLPSGLVCSCKACLASQAT